MQHSPWLKVTLVYAWWWQLYVNFSCWLKPQAPTSKISPPRSVGLRTGRLALIRFDKHNPWCGLCFWKNSSKIINLIWELDRKAESQALAQTWNQNLHFNMFLRGLGCTLIFETHDVAMLFFYLHLKQWHKFAKLISFEEKRLHFIFQHIIYLFL